MDSHRPIHHSNLTANNKQIIIIDDSRIDVQSCPTEEEFNYLQTQEVGQESEAES